MKRRLQRITRELDRMGIDAGTRRNSIIGVTGFETDEDYYKAQEKRFKDFVSQLRMF